MSVALTCGDRLRQRLAGKSTFLVYQAYFLEAMQARSHIALRAVPRPNRVFYNIVVSGRAR